MLFHDKNRLANLIQGGIAMKNHTRINQLLTVLLLLCVLFVCMAGTAFAAENVGIAIDLSTLTETYLISDSGEYTFQGSGSYGIKVESGNPTIVLNNASITVGEGSAIDVASGSNATIFVLGDNTIGTTKTESWNEPCGGIFVAEGGTVNITSNGTNNILRAHGTLAAAIGGKYDYDNNESYNAGSINISNVTVYAYTNNFYASAIGAAGEGTCGTINITNAVIYAYGAGDRWTSAPGIGNAWSLLDWSDTIPIVIISDSEVHTFRYNPYSDYIGYLGDESGDTYATGSINCGDGGSVKNSTIYCYTGLTATTTDKTVKYGALGSLLVEDENGNWVCEGEHTYANGVCANCGYKCTHEGGEHTTAIDNGDGTHSFTCSICGEVTEEHSTEKDENKTNCQHGNICDLCGVEYSEPDAHSYNVDGFCEMCSTANPDATMFFIYDGDHKAFNVAEDLVGVSVEYTRILHNTEWNSIYLPFEVPVTEELLDEYEFAYVNDMHSADTDDNGEIDEIEMEIVKIKTGTLHANHPYFIRAKSRTVTEVYLFYEKTTLHATEETTLNCSSIYMDYAIVGSYKRIKGTEFASMPADRYYAISIEGGWWQIPEDSSLYPFRVYLSMTARDGSPVKVSDKAMRSIRIREKGEGTTGIEEITDNRVESTEIYDLQGRKVEVPNKGLYIINGKKVLIK